MLRLIVNVVDAAKPPAVMLYLAGNSGLFQKRARIIPTLVIV
jgi:hypothetical protein